VGFSERSYLNTTLDFKKKINHIFMHTLKVQKITQLNHNVIALRERLENMKLGLS
jgi:hypothetical protein